MVLRERLATRSNALNFARLLLAGMVIVSHTWPAGGFGPEPRLGDLTLGSWAVAGFFAISGYLITASRIRLNLLDFARRRTLRIFPGFWVCLIMIAFVFAPLGAAAAGTPFHVGRAFSFIWLNSTTFILQWGVGAELRHVPYPGVWNASLWTLTHELICYILAGLTLGWAWARRDVVRVSVAAFTAITVFNLASAQVGVTRGTIIADLMRLAAYFAAGSLLWSLGNRLRVTWWQVSGCLGLLGLFARLGVVDLLGALPLAYLVLAFGAWSPMRWGARRDLSYGVYVYAWPVQQLLALWGFTRFGPAACIAATITLVLPLAWLSWTFVERPSLMLGRPAQRARAAAVAQVPSHAATHDGGAGDGST